MRRRNQNQSRNTVFQAEEMSNTLYQLQAIISALIQPPFRSSIHIHSSTHRCFVSVNRIAELKCCTHTPHSSYILLPSRIAVVDSHCWSIKRLNRLSFVSAVGKLHWLTAGDIAPVSVWPPRASAYSLHLYTVYSVFPLRVTRPANREVGTCSFVY
jgi:hypothetical protein